MLGLNKQSLLFPRLVFLRDGQLNRDPHPVGGDQHPHPAAKIVLKKTKMVYPKPESVRLYQLDWAGIEHVKIERLKENYEKNHKDRMPWCPPPIIPRSYADKMDKLVYAIPDSYMKGMNHMCQAATVEWEHPYPYDTIIRERCYKAVLGYVESSFMLLSDCIYDENKRYYSRDHGPAIVFRHMGMLRFWRMQVGLFPAFEYAGFQTKIYERTSWQPYAYPEIDAMHHDMHDFMQLLTAQHERDYASPELPSLKKK